MRRKKPARPWAGKQKMINSITFATIGLFFMFGFSQAKQMKLLNERDFTKLYVKTLKRLDKKIRVKINGDLDVLVSKDGTDSFERNQYLHNSYQTYRQEPDNLHEVLNLYANSTIVVEDFKTDVDMNNIVPVIKDSAWLSEVEKTLKEKHGDTARMPYVWERYNDELVIVYVQDTRTNIQYFTKDNFKDLNIDRDTLRQLAVRNLSRILPKVERQGGEGFYMVTAGGDYEASLILLSDIWTIETFPVDGEIVISIPARDVLLVTGNKDKGNLEKMRTISEDVIAKGGYYLTNIQFVLKDGRFRKLGK